MRARYGLRSDGRISVFNTATRGDNGGSIGQICGWAYQVDDDREGHLKVR